MKEQRFRKLEVWNKAMTFVEEIYRITSKFPAKEMYGLTSQLRRSAVSIALNIAEGSGTDSDREFKRFLIISLRSSYETMCGIEIANRLRYCSDKENVKLVNKCDELSAMLSGFIKKLKADS
ncbi:MAG: four helix bundle protein [Candidatus Omnitrophota bacterium]